MEREGNKGRQVAARAEVCPVCGGSKCVSAFPLSGACYRVMKSQSPERELNRREKINKINSLKRAVL